MTFEPSLILEYLNSAGPESASAIATFTSFFLDVGAYFAEKNRAQETATIEDYLERLRRQEHAQLADLIRDNRGAFAKLFSELQQSLLAEFGGLHDKIDQLRDDLTDMAVDPARIKMSLDNAWEAEAFVIDGSPQSAVVRAKLTVVNQNRTELTLRNISGWLTRGVDKFSVECRDKAVTISGGGASATVVLLTKAKITHRRGDAYALPRITLKCDQCDRAIDFELLGDNYIPINQRDVG